jgi:hypothetical protein
MNRVKSCADACLRAAFLFAMLHSALAETRQSSIAPASAKASGFYSYIRVIPKSKKWSDLNIESIKSDFIDGASIMLYWKDVEPRMGMYNWDALDDLVSVAITYKKSIAIGIESGGFTPDWVYAPSEENGGGVSKITFSPYDINPPNGKCRDLNEPAVWEPAYIDNYIEAVRALSEHLRAFRGPGVASGAAYKAVQIVKLAGIDLQTDELRVNAHPPGGRCTWSDGTEGREPDAASIWAAAGYRPEKIVRAWEAIAKGVSNAFPDKILNVSIIPRGAFPPIDQDGRIDENANLNPPASDPMTVRLLTQSVSTYGRRLLVQWNSLSQFQNARTGAWILPREVLNAAKGGARIGWQLNNSLGPYSGAACIYPPFNKGPCKTLEDFEQIFKAGEDNFGVYFELQPADVVPQYRQLPAAGGLETYAPAIRKAHLEFWAQKNTNR